jgi:hypothetical protein
MNDKHKVHKNIMCFAAYLWFINEKDCLKKMILDDAFREVQNYGLDELANEATLMQAMQKQLRGIDYIQGQSLKLTENEKVQLNNKQKYYKSLYIDAFVAIQQCNALRIVPDQINVEKKNPENKDIFEAGPQNDSTESLIFICYHNWLANNKTNKISPEYAGSNLVYKYRDIQKDSMRCYLLYIPI